MTDLRPHIHGMWSAVAGSWAEHASFVDGRHERATRLMIERTSPMQGERVLDLACGPGGVTLAVAPLVDPGEVIASDVAVEMVAVAVARAHGSGHSNVHGRRIDLEAIDEPEASFDAVLCRDGLQFAIEPARAAAEMGRVLRPGSRAGVIVWGDRARNPWLGIVLDAASEQLGHPVPPPGMPGPFALGDRHLLERLFGDAGFVDVAVEEVSTPLRAPTFEDWWQMTTALAGPLALVIAGLDDDATHALEARAREAVSPFQTADGIEIPGEALVLSARRAPGD